MKIDISRELEFRTARSGGKGGQNVNKVETMVEGMFHVSRSLLLTAEQKGLVLEKYGKLITADGYLTSRSQATRSQWHNKLLVVEKINTMISQALERKKARISTKPTRQSREKRISFKKRRGDVKETRRKIEKHQL